MVDRIVLPKPCKLCGFEMKEERMRCWDCNVDLCEPCYAKDEPANPHSGHLVSKDDVDSLRPVTGPIVRCILFIRTALFQCVAQGNASQRF